jgi:predicted permease
MSWITQTFKQAAQRLIRTPFFTLVTLITVSVGIGANVAVFSVVEGVVLKPLPYPHPETLVGVWHTAPGLNIEDINLAPANYFIYREQNRVFEDIGIFSQGAVSVLGNGKPEQVQGLSVTEGVLPILGIRPMLGRWFNRADILPSSPDTVMLEYGFWQRRFSSDQSIVGRTLIIDGKQRQIIGVMPRQFRFLDRDEIGLFLPLRLDRNKTQLGEFAYDGIARLRPGVTLAQANADLARMIPIVWNSFPAPEGFSIDLFQKIRLGPKIRPIARDLIGDIGPLLWVLMSGISVVLLIACANVANLLLVRAEARGQELAVRSALGAKPRHIVADFLIESLMIGACSACIGLILAWSAIRLLVAINPTGLPRLQDIGIDGWVLCFTVAITLACSLLIGCIPALRYATARPVNGLRQGGRSASAGRERNRTRNALVVIQVSLAFVLLICSGLMFRTFWCLTHLDPGFDASAGIQTFRMVFPDDEIPESARVLQLQQTIDLKLRALPGVTSAAFANAAPMDGGRWSDPVFVEGKNYGTGALPPLRRFKFVSPGYFQTFGIPFIAGHEFTWAEVYQRTPLAIVSESFAREAWGSPINAIGKRIRVSTKDDWREVIGVVGDVHDDGMNRDAPSIAWWPTVMNHFESNDENITRNVAFAIRSGNAGSEEFMRAVRNAVWSVDANLPVFRVHPERFYYTSSMAHTSLMLILLSVAAVIAQLIGVVGLYGTIAYTASQRTKEFGIRIALGAQRRDIIGMMVRQGILLAAGGVICGLLLSAGVTHFLRSFLFHTSPTDPATYVCAGAVLLAAAVLASYLPSRRSATIDPSTALRSE